jgi:hypothetical protein
MKEAEQQNHTGGVGPSERADTTLYIPYYSSWKKKKKEKSSEATAGAAQFDCVFIYVCIYV